MADSSIPRCVVRRHVGGQNRQSLEKRHGLDGPDHQTSVQQQHSNIPSQSRDDPLEFQRGRTLWHPGLPDDPPRSQTPGHMMAAPDAGLSCLSPAGLCTGSCPPDHPTARSPGCRISRLPNHPTARSPSRNQGATRPPANQMATPSRTVMCDTTHRPPPRPFVLPSRTPSCHLSLSLSQDVIMAKPRCPTCCTLCAAGTGCAVLPVGVELCFSFKNNR